MREPARRRTRGTRRTPAGGLDVAIAGWLAHLGAERRYSPHTLAAYERDLRQFVVFLTEHLGQKPALGELENLAPRDVRAFLSARRAQGLRGRSLMRQLAGVRSFARFLGRTGRGSIEADPADVGSETTSEETSVCRTRSTQDRSKAKPDSVVRIPVARSSGRAASRATHAYAVRAAQIVLTH